MLNDKMVREQFSSGRLSVRATASHREPPTRVDGPRERLEFVSHGKRCLDLDGDQGERYTSVLKPP